ncbi:MAG TPA: Wzz/FepE/Etk N-terminal domain-containing protein [Thermoleophilaceae bacterium]|jgi:Mrp family chromosome partitioning ATPase/capsular polysaccharide biosynthesis protein
MASPDRNGRTAEWLRPRLEQQGLQRYVNTIRERIKLILAVTLLTTGAAVAYVLLAEKEYTAEADMLVTPAPSDDPALSGLPLIKTSSDPTRDVETAARLIVNRDVALRVRSDLGLTDSATVLKNRVKAEPVAQSNIVSISAVGDSPRKAQRLANAFARAVIEVQTDQLRRALDKKIANLQSQLQALGAGARGGNQPGSLGAQLASLQALRSGDDPTLSVETRAAPPDGPSSPKKKLSIVAGLLAGLILGIGSAFALQVLDPRLRREEQLRSLYGLPILGRIPKEGRRGGQRALAPERLSPATLEAYRTLRATLAASRGAVVATNAPAVLVTSPSPSEGKSTTAINLASSLALAGNSVILIEADLRRPSIGEALGVSGEFGTGTVLLGMANLQEALVETKAYGRYLRLLLADKSGAASGFMADQLFLPAARTLVEDAKGLADYVIVDSPPLSEVIDALPLAQRVDEVLVVVRLGKTQLLKLQNLAELLARHDIEPVGFSVVGVQATGEGYYYTPTSTAPERGRSRPAQGPAPSARA